MEEEREARPTSDAAEPTLEQAPDDEESSEDQDAADKASEDSFPTSDPPAW